MNELEKIRQDLDNIMDTMMSDMMSYRRSMDDSMRAFRAAMTRAREIERAQQEQPK